MPGVEDWINGPIPIINRLFDGNHKSLQDKVKEYFEQKLQNAQARSWIPSLNSSPQHQLKHNSLVRFRCMIQDMFDPEYYMGVYEVQDESGQTTLHTGMYKDIADCRPGQKIVEDSPKTVTLDRQTFYCVPIPAENEWVKEVYTNYDQQKTSATMSSTSNRSKRPHDDSDSRMETEVEKTNGHATSAEVATFQSGDSKKAKTDENADKKEAKPPSLNFPLPGERGPACLVKIYESGENFKVNDTVEFIGILSNDPLLANFNDPNNQQSAFADAADAAMETAEEEAHCPPPSLVPRLHVVGACRLAHSNPLLPPDVNSENRKAEVDGILKEAEVIRNELVGLFKECLFGDVLAAEYLLCHLISSVYARQDVVALGKFALNLSGLPRDCPYVAKLYSILRQVVAKSYLMPLTLTNMNSSRLVPAKDYSANRLVAGQLQLSERTHLVLDETAMQAGQLDTTGVKNITALGTVIQWQRVEYDFNFHKVNFNTNIMCLVLSEGKSLMKCDCRVHLQPASTEAAATPNLDAHFSSIESKLSSGLLVKLRTFLGLVQLLPYELPPELQKDIEEDFVELRKADPKNLTVDDFHTLLVLGRLLSLSFGKSALTKELWEKTKRMEAQRKLRIANENQTAVSN